MNRKWKLAALIILTVVFGFSGINYGIGGVMAGYDVAYGIGAFLPFVVCLIAAFEQYGNLKKENITKPADVA